MPKKPYMERSKKIWEELGLPPLRPQSPWFGYSLGEWGQEFDAMAARATAGDQAAPRHPLRGRRTGAVSPSSACAP